jgi:hypothetical protein
MVVARYGEAMELRTITSPGMIEKVTVCRLALGTARTTDGVSPGAGARLSPREGDRPLTCVVHCLDGHLHGLLFQVSSPLRQYLLFARNYYNDVRILLRTHFGPARALTSRCNRKS